jgi:thiol:disulfide interchange protein
VKHKSKQKHKPRRTSVSWRTWAGGAVGVAIVAIVLVKLLGQTTSGASAGELPTVSVAGGATSVEVAVATPPGGTVVATTAASAGGVESQQPWPASPAEQVQLVLGRHQPAMVLFHSTNCIPCKAMEKLVAEVRGDYEPSIAFIDVITGDQANSALLQQAQIQAIPTSFFFNTAGQGKRYVGAMKKDALRAELDTLLAGGQ